MRLDFLIWEELIVLFLVKEKEAPQKLNQLSVLALTQEIFKMKFYIIFSCLVFFT